MTNHLLELAEWQALQAHQKTIASETMQTWFATDAERFERFSLQLGEIMLDFSKNRVNSTTIDLLSNLAKATNLGDKINNLFSGQNINSTEQRPALHTALRNRRLEPVYVNDCNIMPQVKTALDKMQQFSDQVRHQEWLGATGKPIRDIVNIGIGGSHLGPLMAVHALSDFATDKLRCHFISNIDSAHLNEVFKQIDPETTLFIISSKSFSTLETMTNAKTIRHWLQQKIGDTNLSRHFVAVTAAADKALAFGIPAEQIFPVWDWVGGRYSVWSAIGLPLVLMIGMDNFLEFLAGGHAMDEHFRYAEFTKNMPVMLALLGIWYINFFGAQSHAIVPYAHQLNYFRAHLQQLDMESNGKRTTHPGKTIDYATGPIIFGEHGCNGQHAFHQLFHQGQCLVPIDFILVGSNNHGLHEHQDILIASALSQAQALLQGKSTQQALDELLAQGYTGQDAALLAQHKSIPGNRPSNILFLQKMTPNNLGALLALYEHKIFVQGAIWDINSFDQWGVELGKQLLPNILDDLQNNDFLAKHDASTRGLIAYYKNLRSQS
ncbi:MAG: glucose-6-phosphate isomerase [Gammaproteobacteria bacterium]